MIKNSGQQPPGPLLILQWAIWHVAADTWRVSLRSQGSSYRVCNTTFWGNAQFTGLTEPGWIRCYRFVAGRLSELTSFKLDYLLQWLINEVT